MKTLLRRAAGRKGQSLTEYILIVALVAIASIAIVTIFGNQIRSLFSASSKQLSGDESAQTENKSTNADNEVEKQLDKF
ncbi:MAG: hypothetical protein V1809_08560 [Planctomycetota bacterium]